MLNTIKNCYFILDSQLSNINVADKLKKLKVNLIPIVNKNKKVVDYISDDLRPSNFNFEKNKKLR